jgi:hypothetical protein
MNNAVLEVLTGLNLKLKVNITSYLKRKERKLINHRLINLLHAADVVNNNSYKPLNTVDYEEGEYFLPSTFPSPEELYSKKEALLKLPKESFLILQLIYNCPTEILEHLGNHPGGKYKGRLTKYIQSHFNWKPSQINKALNKLKTII